MKRILSDIPAAPSNGNQSDSTSTNNINTSNSGYSERTFSPLKHNGGYNSSQDPVSAKDAVDKVIEAVWLLIIFVVYVFAGKLGLSLANENINVSAVWAPTGIALAAVLLKGYRVWTAIILGAFIVNFTTSGNISSSVFIASGNTAEALLGAYLVNNFCGGKYFYRSTQNIFKFVIAGIISTAMCAAFGSLTLEIFGLAEWKSFLSVWTTWFLGDLAGAILVAPLIILWVQEKTDSIINFRIGKERLLEAFAVGMTLIIVCLIEFSPFSVAATENYPLAYIIFIPFIWISFRFSIRFVATAVFSICIIAIWGTTSGYGPFVVSTADTSLLFLQAFICTLSIMCISLASVISERNRNEKTVRDNEKELRDFIENAAVGINGVGPDGMILWANKCELDLLGYTSEEYVGHHISEFHADQNKISNILTLLGNNKIIQNYETQLVCKDGSKKDVLISSNVLWKNGEFIYTRCFTRDITDRKRVEQELLHNKEALHESERKSRKEFQQLLEKLPAGAYTCDTNGLITFYNEKAVEIWGREPKLNDPADRFCGSFRLYIGDESITHDSCWMALAIQKNKGFNGEEIIIERPDGSRLTAIAHANPIHDENGKIAGAVNVLVDISDRKLAEKHLNIQYSISKSLAESDSLSQASQKLLKSVCEGLGWELGIIWLVDKKADVLRLESEWHSERLKIENSGMIDPDRVFKKGIGLPGRVWEQNNSAWIPDVIIDNNFPRAPYASSAGLHAGLAFPIRSGNEVIGVIECFNKKILQPKEVLLEVLNASGIQIGNFLRRKLAEEEKEIAQQTYQLLFESTLDGILIVDDGGTLVNVNESYCRMVKGKKEELIGKSFSGFMHPDWLDQAQLAFRDLKTKGYFKGEFPILALDGSLVYAEWLSKADFLPGFHFCVARDITERKALDEKHKLEYSFRKAVENSIGSGIAAVNPNGVQTYVNPALCSMLGWTEEELINTPPPHPYWPPEEMENIVRAFETTLEGNAPKEGFELRFCRKNGERFDVLVIVTPIKNSDGTILNWLASVTDITEMKKVHKALKNARDEFEFRVKERTMELKYLVEDMEKEISERKRTGEKLRLTNEKLKETQYELIHSEKLASLGRFSSGIAHEIRNPLANISALAQFLNSRKDLDPDFKKHLGYILENTNIANNIIKDLLNIAAPHNVNFTESNIEKLLDNLCNIVSTRCEKARIKLRKNFNGDLPSIMINEEKLKSSFLNFISNAIEAMPEGGNLDISALRDKQTNEAVINFEDTGCGIAPENLDKIIEPFFTTKKQGTGLGLCLAYHVIQAHGGRIDIKSKVNEGTKISLRLPINHESDI